METKREQDEKIVSTIWYERVAIVIVVAVGGDAVGGDVLLYMEEHSEIMILFLSLTFIFSLSQQKW